MTDILASLNNVEALIKLKNNRLKKLAAKTEDIFVAERNDFTGRWIT